MWHRGLCYEVCKLLGYILGSHVMVLLLQLLLIYSEFLSLSQLFPFHTLGLGLRNRASSQGQSIANLRPSCSASSPPLKGKKCTFYSIHEEIVLTMMTLFFATLAFHIDYSFSLSQTWHLIFKVKFLELKTIHKTTLLSDSISHNSKVLWVSNYCFCYGFFKSS